MPSFPPELQSVVEVLRADVEKALAQCCQFDDDCPPRLADAISYCLLANGKRLRPMLVLMACEACGGDRSLAIPAACAVEMIHTYSLIHDDLPAMDDDDMRRGRPSCHKQFDEATAILAGDALIPLAFEVMADQLDSEIAAPCCRELARAAGASALVGGQVDDLNADASIADRSSVEAIHRRKTGALFRVSLRLGAMVARATGEQLQALDTYGQKLGLAFQIVDDLLDHNGDESVVGKRTGKDAESGKTTFPMMLGVDESRRAAEQLIGEALSAIEIFGNNGASLDGLARFVLNRNR